MWGSEGQKTSSLRASETEKDGQAARVDYTSKLTMGWKELDYETLKTTPSYHISQLWGR